MLRFELHLAQSLSSCHCPFLHALWLKWGSQCEGYCMHVTHILDMCDWKLWYSGTKLLIDANQKAQLVSRDQFGLSWATAPVLGSLVINLYGTLEQVRSPQPCISSTSKVCWKIKKLININYPVFLKIRGNEDQSAPKLLSKHYISISAFTL